VGWQELSDKEELMKEILAKTEEEPIRNEAATCFNIFEEKLDCSCFVRVLYMI
jgi:hypothetical protein